MRAFVVLVLSSLALVALAFATAESEGVRAHMSKAATHCGCVNKDNCTEPCATCCGPGGYSDCFKNPSPSCCSVTSGG